jgi:hypothetical protein
LSVIIPLEVESIATPKPFNTRGIDDAFEYFLKPGVLMRSSLVIADSRVSGLYFNAIFIFP